MKIMLIILLIAVLSIESYAQKYTCPKLFGKFENELDCRSYTLCIFGGAIHKECDKNYHFSELLQRCVFGPCIEVEKVNLTYTLENYENELKREKEMERLVEKHESQREEEKKDLLKKFERQQELKEEERQLKLRELERLQEYKEKEQRRREIRKRIELLQEEKRRQHEQEELLEEYRRELEERNREKKYEEEQKRTELLKEMLEKQKELNAMKREMEAKRKELERLERLEEVARKSSLCPSMFGQYKNKKDCKSFYVCVFGVPYLKHCKKNQHYSENLEKCVRGPCYGDEKDMGESQNTMPLRPHQTSPEPENLDSMFESSSSNQLGGFDYTSKQPFWPYAMPFKPYQTSPEPENSDQSEKSDFDDVSKPTTLSTQHSYAETTQNFLNLTTQYESSNNTETSSSETTTLSYLSNEYTSNEDNELKTFPNNNDFVPELSSNNSSNNSESSNVKNSSQFSTAFLFSVDEEQELYNKTKPVFI